MNSVKMLMVIDKIKQSGHALFKAVAFEERPEFNSTETWRGKFEELG